MLRRSLGKTGIETSALGFGCVQLTSCQSTKNAVSILENALSAGITHFDIARSYGFGRAEGIFSSFLHNKRSSVTVATKFGFELPAILSGNPKLISFAKKILKPFPSLLQRAKNHGSSMVNSSIFNPESMIKSLEKSLFELKTDYIDIFLLHEALLTDTTNLALTEALQTQVAKGKIRCFGIASDFGKISGGVELIPAAYKILQSNDDTTNLNIQKLQLHENCNAITHSVFKHFNSLRRAISKNPVLADSFLEQTDLDLNESTMLSALLLHHSLQNNPNGIVLFSSMNPLHIKTNAIESTIRRFNQSQLSKFSEFANLFFKINEMSLIS